MRPMPRLAFVIIIARRIMTAAVAPVAARIPIAAPITPTVVMPGAALLAAPARTAVIRTAALAVVLAAL
jgi:hypothetical protein